MYLPYEVKYHVHLALLLKPSFNEREAQLLNPFIRGAIRGVEPTENPVFLFEHSQLYGSNEHRRKEFLATLGNYIGLVRPSAGSPLGDGRSHQASRIDICASRYDQLREELLLVGEAASEWIRDFFLEAPDVTVYAHGHFQGLIERWGQDPCSDRE